MRKKILWIDGSVRESSRTRTLAQTVIDHLNGEITHLRIEDEAISPLTGKTLNKRDELLAAGQINDPMLKYARQFAEANEIVISAPYWDLAFPAALKVYLEAVTVCGITFRYSEEGMPIGLCKSKVLYYVTTSGGEIGDLNFGEQYIQNLAQKLYGIPKIHCFTAERLDIIGSDSEQIMAEAKAKVHDYFKNA